MNRKLAAVIMIFAAAAGYAQSVTGGGIATQFNQWRAYGSTNLVAGANPLVPISPCAQTAAGTNFFALSANTPIKIVDPNNAAIDEVLTPTAVVAGSTCTATFTTVNAHTTPWYIVSGSFGLQEAINNTAQTSALNTVALSPSWFAAGGNAATIYNVTGSPYLVIEAGNIRPVVAYRWNGTHYATFYAPNTTVTLAAGAAAGASPTVSNNTLSNGNIMTANVTTGTATTTGALFTETETTTFTGNANCVVQSIGANVPPAFTVATTPTVLTVSVAVAPPTATAYIFGITCN